MSVQIHLVGTSHIAEQSLRDVERAFAEIKPTIVAIELDKGRMHALLHPELRTAPRILDIPRIGFKGWLFAVLGHWVEHKLGQSVGVAPGADMLKAVQLARGTGARIALIDRPIESTLSRLSSAITWREKGRFFVDMVTAPFRKTPLTFDLRTVPDAAMITKLLEQVAPRYPSVYRVLVTERNKYMADRLKQLAATHPESRMVVVIGAGHIAGVHEILTGGPAPAG